MNLIHSKLVFFLKKKLLIKLTHGKKTVHANSASELHCSLFLSEQCNSLPLFMLIALTVREKQEFLAFHYLRFGRKNHVGSMNNKSFFFSLPKSCKLYFN
jgi:hypothetical protein